MYEGVYEDIVGECGLLQGITRRLEKMRQAGGDMSKVTYSANLSDKMLVAL